MSIRLYRKRYVALALIGALLMGMAVPAQPERQEAIAPVTLLIVDETRTFQASLLVNLLAAALHKTELFDIEAKFVEVASSFDDPLGVNSTAKRYELILVVPRGIEQGLLSQIWIATCPLNHGTRPEIHQGVQTIKILVAEGSKERVRALGVNDDALPGYFARLFELHGWLRCER